MDDLADVLNALAPTLRERVFPTILETPRPTPDPWTGVRP
jgi:hypothetical protein